MKSESAADTHSKKLFSPKKYDNLPTSHAGSGSFLEIHSEAASPLAVEEIQLNNIIKSKASASSLTASPVGSDDEAEEDQKLVSDEDRELFIACSRSIQQQRSWLGRSLSWLYAERKVVFCFILHIIATLVIWQHFFQRKYYEKFAA